MRLSHRDARILGRESFARQFAREANRPEAQLLQSVGWIESRYSSGWNRPANWPKGEPFEPWNMGAIQKGSWTGKTFWYIDTHPKADGTNEPYRIEFRYYDSPQQGFDDLCRRVYVILDRMKRVLAPATRGDTLGFSTGLHATGYYEGFGKTVADRIRHHHEAILNACALQAQELGEAMPDGSSLVAPPKPMYPTLRLASRGEAVKALQLELGFTGTDVDGKFGRMTLAAVTTWQRNHGLKVDGVVGPATWKSLEAAA